MANIKNFGLVGVGSDVQFGKSGPRLANDAGVFKFKTANGAALADIQAQNLTLGGNLTVQGDTTTLNVSTLTVEDKNITLGSGTSDAALLSNAGIEIGDDGAISFKYQDASKAWTSSQILDMSAKKIINLAVGTVATDAINLGQLTSAVTTINGDIAAEVARATAAEGVLTDDLADEVTRATAAELAEKTRAEAAEGVLTTNLAAEVTRATGVEADLQSQIDALETGSSDAVAALQAEVDRAEAALGLAADGTLVAFTGATTSASTTFAAAITALDTALVAEAARAAAAELAEKTRAEAAEGVIAGNLAAEVTRATDAEDAIAADLADEVTRATAAEAALQAELDATQAAAGLSAAGAYVPATGANYIASATTLADADSKLDAALKQVADDLAALGAGSLTDLQAEVDLIETGLGFAADGSKAAFTSVNFILAGDTVVAGINKLDAALKAEEVRALAAELVLTNGLAQEVSDRQAAITAEIAARDAAILVEKTRAEAAEAALAADLEAAINGLGSMAAQDSDAVAITGGTIDGTVIGGVTAAAGKFTDLVAATAKVSNLAAGGMVFAGTDGLLSTDAGISYNAATDTLTVVGNIIAATPTQDSHVTTKAYVDSVVSAGVTNAGRGVYALFSGAETTIGVVKGLVHRLKVYVDVATGAGSDIQVGTTAVNGELATTADVDSSVAGVYVVEVSKLYATDTTLKIFGAAGISGTIVVEYL